jgi:hypothetical protein
MAEIVALFPNYGVGYGILDLVETVLILAGAVITMSLLMSQLLLLK